MCWSFSQICPPALCLITPHTNAESQAGRGALVLAGEHSPPSPRVTHTRAARGCPVGAPMAGRSQCSRFPRLLRGVVLHFSRGPQTMVP